MMWLQCWCGALEGQCSVRQGAVMAAYVRGWLVSEGC